MNSPFSLACYECDDGQNVETREEAFLLGWTDVEEDDDADTWWTWIGYCPICTMEAHAPYVPDSPEVLAADEAWDKAHYTEEGYPLCLQKP